MQRIIALGFNTVKVPFSFNDLYGLVPNNYTESCTQLTAQQLQVRTACPTPKTVRMLLEFSLTRWAMQDLLR